MADLRPRDAADAPQGACTASTRRPTELLIFILTLNFVERVPKRNSSYVIEQERTTSFLVYA